MNHLVNRRMLKRQQMRWSVEGAQLMLQTRVDLLGGYLLRRFRSLYPQFRSPDLRVSQDWSGRPPPSSFHSQH
jgi:hypothetical protein